VVIFHGITRLQDLTILKPGNCSKESFLNLRRKACGNAIGIDSPPGPPLGLKENLMTVPVLKPNDLVFNRRTITGSWTRDSSPEHGGKVSIAGDDFMGLRRGPGEPTGDLLQVEGRAPKGKGAWDGIPGLLHEGGEINAGLGKPGGCPRFVTAQTKAERPKVAGEVAGRSFPDAASGRGAFATVANPSKEGASRQDHRRANKIASILEANTSDIDCIGHAGRIPRNPSGENFPGFGLENFEAGLAQDTPNHGAIVDFAVTLGAGGTNGRTLRCV
jgi:hypothetical protein